MPSRIEQGGPGERLGNGLATDVPFGHPPGRLAQCGICGDLVLEDLVKGQCPYRFGVRG
ncbi:hypothetical protein [Nonomuraea basaltis]|uniref:hypothetical protein n=1 Tax=Nonomuraea basaltis TaxID=2495887 RepID=UPI001486228C|nr:hypothetical protein [Nonomuraea basaltis]